MGNLFSSTQTDDRANLARSIAAGDVQRCKAIVVKNPDAIKLDGFNAIHECVRAQQHLVLAALLSLIQSFDSTPSMPASPRSPMSRGASSSKPSSDSMTHVPQISASAMVKKAIDSRRGAGVTPLMMAAQNSDLKAVQMLLNAGADPWRADKVNRQTALHFAALHNSERCILPIMERSLSLQLQPRMKRGSIFARFSVVVEQEPTLTSDPDSIPLVDLSSRSLFTPLMMAAARDHAETAEKLLHAGASYKIRRGW